MDSLMIKYPLFKVHVNDKIAIENLSSVFRSGFINEGEQVVELENELCAFLGVNQLTLVNSCTSAISMALRIIGVGQGDEVISTAMTCVATNTPIINMNGTIVWSDIDPNTGMLCPSDVEKLISPKTKAIIVVDWAGTPANLSAFRELSERYSIPIIQDAAHAFGATYEGKPISDFAQFTCLSFQAIKHFTTGDGGALICQSPADHQLARKLKWFGYDRDAVKDKKGEWKGQKWDADILAEEVGYKFNMNNMAAAVGLANLPSMTRVLDKHRKNASAYEKFFRDHPKITLLSCDPAAVSSHWVYTLRLEIDEIQRDLILDALNSAGIGAGLVHLPNNTYSAFREFDKSLPNTKLFSRSQISLPCGWWLSESDVSLIARTLIAELDTFDV
jgi:dTDP-4-amino-4,6-dideoxygalactose transaminase